jgi:putative transposon-encoded protein
LLYKDIHVYPIARRLLSMPRKIEVRKGDLTIKETVEVVYERVITPFGNSAKIDAPKKYIGKRAYAIIIKD